MLLYVERTWVKPFERAPTRDDLLHGLSLEIGRISEVNRKMEPRTYTKEGHDEEETLGHAECLGLEVVQLRQDSAGKKTEMGETESEDNAHPKAENPRPRKNIRNVKMGRSMSSLREYKPPLREIWGWNIPSAQDLDSDVVGGPNLVLGVGRLAAGKTGLQGLCLCQLCLIVDLRHNLDKPIFRFFEVAASRLDVGELLRLDVGERHRVQNWLAHDGEG